MSRALSKKEVQEQQLQQQQQQQQYARDVETQEHHASANASVCDFFPFVFCYPLICLPSHKWDTAAVPKLHNCNLNGLVEGMAHG